MELSGKVIIFESKEDAEIWYKAIKEVQHKEKMESEYMKTESIRYRQKSTENH